jgi:anthranilate synthase component 1
MAVSPSERATGSSRGPETAVGSSRGLQTAAGYRPGPETFAELAATHPVVPVWRELLADLQTPVAVYDRLSGDGPTFLLESVERGERWGRYSFVGLHPFASLRAHGGQVVVEGELPATLRRELDAAAAGGGPLATLERALELLGTPRLANLPPLFAGAVGHVGYDTVRMIEAVPDSGVDELGTDDLRLIFPGQLVAFDHLRQCLTVVANVVIGDDPSAQYAEAVAACEALVDRLASPVRAGTAPAPQIGDVGEPASNMTRADYIGAVEEAKEQIAAGDAYQVTVSQRFSTTTEAEPLTVYRVLRVINPSPYMYLFDYGDTQVVGSSPEALVTVADGSATIQPIAGSRPRGESEAEDTELAAELAADEKERAEHVMLVDLARNDLGRVCRLGTVTVPELMEVVRYSHVMHLVSRVRGEITDGAGPIDVLRATFPAGTLTGAPKVRAMQLIDELEPTRRGLYGGGIGYFDLAGNLDLCIAIRTVVFRGGRAHVQAGAGVVADSDADAEYAETQAKAGALLAAIRAAEAMQDGEEVGRQSPGTVAGERAR